GSRGGAPPTRAHAPPDPGTRRRTCVERTAASASAALTSRRPPGDRHRARAPQHRRPCHGRRRAVSLPPHPWPRYVAIAGRTPGRHAAHHRTRGARMTADADVIVVGAGLAGLVATYELTRAGRRVLVVDQENEANLGGQAFWSLGGIFLVNSPEQRRMGIKDSYDLALQDWMGSAGFDREREDHWPRQWAQAYVQFAAGEKRAYMHGLGMRFMPTVGWAERGRGTALDHGNSVPRFHISWGTGPEVVRIFAEPVRAAAEKGLVSFRP